MVADKPIQLDGQYLPAFQTLADCFADNFRHYGETGAAIAVYLDGQLVVDYFGSCDSANGPWRADHRVCTMSTGKAPLALCVHLLAERGQLALDEPVATYWPEFGQAGKQDISIRQLLNHSAGLPISRRARSGDIFNWKAMCWTLEKTAPSFPPGEELVYHALSYGHLLGELIRRVDGRMPADFFHQEIAQPLSIDFDLRSYPWQEIRKINSHSQFKALPLWLLCRLTPLMPGWKSQYFRPCNHHYHPNSRAWTNSEIPAVTSQGSASGLARLYAFLAGGGSLQGQQLFQPQTVAALIKPSMEQTELATGQHWRMGLGFMLNSPEMVSFGPNPQSFGHAGMGGSLGFADPDRQLAFAYVTEHYHQPSRRDPSMCGQRLARLIEACYQCVA